ncbi:indole-3-glycerol phosphate synthase TrpC [Paraburkholderia hayleyella]|uniref:indole-3-glycerol phosphate synthase TrpC n=1 Tax=Paraburkholderia hayleyella TaxID=2152889 RepID=UPI0015804535|nr:indole-3-glycerol phosphate synthase TrpC [Paraburkholderia hayleyella]
MNILDTIKTYKIEEVQKAWKDRPLSSFESTAARLPAPRDFVQAIEDRIAQDQIALIAEIKRASPSKGIIREAFNVAEIATAYQRGGATCLSVLTDEHFFLGSAQDLKTAKEVSHLPVLRKDFIVDPYQVYEARAMNADCILLILAMLEDDLLVRELAEIAARLDMGVLVEVHDEHEAERALSMNAKLVGVNNRNLSDFSIDLSVSERLSRMLNPHCVVVSESGITSETEVLRLRAGGIKSLLIGEQLMRAPDIERATRSITSL